MVHPCCLALEFVFSNHIILHIIFQQGACSIGVGRFLKRCDPQVCLCISTLGSFYTWFYSPSFWAVGVWSRNTVLFGGNCYLGGWGYTGLLFELTSVTRKENSWRWPIIRLNLPRSWNPLFLFLNHFTESYLRRFQNVTHSWSVLFSI